MSQNRNNLSNQFTVNVVPDDVQAISDTYDDVT